MVNRAARSAMHDRDGLAGGAEFDIECIERERVVGAEFCKAGP